MRCVLIQKKKVVPMPGCPMSEQEFLCESPLIRDLSPELQDALLCMGSVRTLRKGEMLFMAGNPVGSINYLLSGRLQEYYHTEAGDISLRRILAAGDYISMHLLFAKEPIHTYTCEAVSAIRTFSWRTAEFLSLVKQEPALGVQIATVLSAYVESSCRMNCLCRQNQAICRVAGYLLRACNPMYPYSLFQFDKDPERLRVNISPLRLTAHDVGLARETFSRVLSVLQEKNFINLQNGCAEIIDMQGLKRICTND